ALRRQHFPVPAGTPTCFDTLLRAIDGGSDAWSGVQARAALLRLLVELLDAAAQTSNQARSAVVREALAQLDSHVAAPLSLAALARRLGWSVSHLKHAFCAEVGLPPGQYHTRRRIEAAAERLITSDDTVLSVAGEFGFTSASHFATAFRQVVGVTPTEHR